MALCPPLPFAAELPACPPLPAPDAELVVQLQQGSEPAFRLFVERYQRRVYCIALSLLRSPTEAEDVTQEVFVEVYQTIASFRGEAALSTWVYRLATSRALRHRRWAGAKKRLAQLTSLFGLHNEVLHEPPDHAHPQALLESEQQLAHLRARIGQLPRQQQVAFVLRHEHDLSYAEIAAVLATSVAAVESLLHRARHTLRHSLATASRHA